MSADAPQPHPGLDPLAGETQDAICGGEVQLLQHLHGYRFTLDPVLLAHFVAEAHEAGATVDLGTGCGIIPLILAKKFGWSELLGVELQPGLYDLARRNVRLNGSEGEVALALGDLRETPRLFPRAAFAHVVANPPYRKARAGHLNPDVEKATARHELKCQLRDVTLAATWLLRDWGTLSVVYPAGRLAELLTALRDVELTPTRMQLVHARAHRPAKLVLVSATRGSDAPLLVSPPLVVHAEGRGGFSIEVERMVGPKSALLM